MIAYLDNSATTKPCELAIERMNHSMREKYFNPSSLYAPAVDVEKELNRARLRIRSLLNAPDGTDVLFTSGGTEANNLALIGAVSMMRGPQHVITSAVEHPSVLAACDVLQEMGHKVTVIGVGGDGCLDWDALERAVCESPALVSLMQVNNETGAVLDVKRLSALIREKAPGALIHVDGVQGFLRVPFDMRLVDMYTLSGHKIHGPKGVGALAVRKGVKIKPRQFGGGQQGGLRSGTENVPGIAGLLGAIEYMASFDELDGMLMRKKLRFLSGVLEKAEGALANGPTPHEGAPHIVNLSFPGVRGEVLLHALEGCKVYCSTGSACSSKKKKVSAVLLAMGVPIDRAEAALRFSFSVDTEDDAIDGAIEVIGEQYAQMKRFRRR